MRLIFLIILGVCFCITPAMAVKVTLLDGRVVEGTISKQDNNSIQLNVDGINMTYYADEIRNVDGSPFVKKQREPAPLVKNKEVVITQTLKTTPPSFPIRSLSDSGVDLEKRALILKFIDVFGTRQALVNNFDVMISQIENEKPQEALKIRQRVKVDEIIEHLLPVYDRNFTREDLKSFVLFYGSAEGKKLIKTIPVLMKESVDESIKYMEEKFPEIKKK